MPRLAHFEIHAEDMERAQKFYGDVFGWTFQKWTGPQTAATDPFEYTVITTGPKEEPGINGGMIKRQGPRPAPQQPMNGFVCTMEVSNLDELVTKITDLAGRVVVEKMAIAGVGWLVYCLDTEGNVFGLMQTDAAAK